MDDINAEAKGRFRRIEVLTGSARRRRWSVSEKAQIVAETLAPGGSVSAVARRWQVCPQQVFTWRGKARAGLLTLLLEGTDLVQASFVPIVPEMADAPARRARRSTAGDGRGDAAERDGGWPHCSTGSTGGYAIERAE
jgi:transposase